MIKQNTVISQKCVDGIPWIHMNTLNHICQLKRHKTLLTHPHIK